MRYTITAVVCALLALVFTAIALTYDPPPAAPVVSSFNEGFADSKRDDCTQGFTPACEWLTENTGR